MKRRRELTILIVVVLTLVVDARPAPPRETPGLSEDAAITERAICNCCYIRYVVTVKHFEKLGAEGVPILVELLEKSERREVRQFAAVVLAKIGDRGPAAIPALVRCLAWPNSTIVSNAAAALTAHGETAGPALLKAVRGTDPRLMLQAGELLVEMKIESEALAGTLLSRLRGEEDELRMVAAWLLGRLTGPDHRFADRRPGRMGASSRGRPDKPLRAGAPRIRAAIAAALTDHPDAGVRLAATESLCRTKTGTVEGHHALLYLTRDPDERIRRAATRAVKDLFKSAHPERERAE